MIYFEQVLFLFFIIIGPIIFFQLYCNDEEYFPSHWKPKYIFFVLMCCSSSLLLHFSVFKVWDYSISFIALVMLYTILYGDRKLGVLLLAYIICYDSFLNDRNSLIVFLQTAWFYIIPFVLQLNWKKYSKRIKLRNSVFFSASVCASYLVLVWLNFYRINGYIFNSQLISMSLFVFLCFVSMFYLMVYTTEFLIENRRLKAMAQESEKLMIVSELAAGVAHEVRNPLTVVKGFVKLVEPEVKETSQAYLKLVMSELNRMEDIITDYLNLAKKNKSNNTVISVTHLLSTVHSVMNVYTDLHNVEISLDKEEELYIFGDVSKMKQVCYNLIKNSVEAISHNHGKINIQCYSLDNSAIIEIIDNGSGMEKQQLIRIGEPFYTSKENGTGLGIMITKSIVEQHGGTLHIESEKEKGTKVTMRFPKFEKECE